MTTPSAWRFQWPDGTWIHWNPETEEWEKESGSPDEPPVAVKEPAAPPAEPTVAPPAPVPTAEGSLDDDVVAEELEDDEEEDEGSRTRARPAEEVFAGGPIDERPGKPLMPTILGGAAIGLVVGIVVTILLR